MAAGGGRRRGRVAMVWMIRRRWMRNEGRMSLGLGVGRGGERKNDTIA